jgi:hypothetical protein
VAEAEGSRLGTGSAAELLSNWRAAERDRVAAEEEARKQFQRGQERGFEQGGS